MQSEVRTTQPSCAQLPANGHVDTLIPSFLFPPASPDTYLTRNNALTAC